MYFTYYKYTIECESNGKKEPILWEKYEYQFPGSPHTMGFVGYLREPISQTFPIRWVWLSFPCYGKLMRKHMHFPCDEVYHEMGI